MILCPGCGADMHYDPQKAKLTCKYCASAVTVGDYRKMRASRPELSDLDSELTAKAETAADTVTMTEFTCPQCGAALISTWETAATFCSYCGASVELEGRITREKRPDRIIPFSVTKEQCQAAYRRLLRRSLFIPSEMKRQSRIDRFRGIYMPYWIYNYSQKRPVCLTGKKIKQKKNIETTDFYDVRLPADSECRGIAFDSSSIFYDNLSEGIAPFYPEEGVRFDPAYISGFYADTGDLEPAAYAEKSRSMAAAVLSEKISKNYKLGKYSLDQFSVEERLNLELQKQSGMFPVWFLSTRIRQKKGEEDRISYAAVNGQTGKIAADLPVDFKKYLIGSLILAVPVFLLLNLFFTPTPARMLVAAAALAIIGLILSNRQMERIGWRELRMDDVGQKVVNAGYPNQVYWELSRKKEPRLKTNFRVWLMMLILMAAMIITACGFGFLSASEKIPAILMIPAFPVALFTVGRIRPKRVRMKEEKRPSVMPLGRKFKACWKQFAGLAVILIVLIVRPVSDLFYYGAAILSMLMTAWSFYTIVQEHNELTTRKIPQFGKRGGDRHE